MRLVTLGAAAVVLTTAAIAQDKKLSQQPLLRVVSDAMQRPDDDAVAKHIAGRLKKEFAGKLDELKPEVYRHLERESGDVARMLGRSPAARRRLELATKGAYQRVARRRIEEYESEVDEFLSGDRIRFLQKAMIDCGSPGYRLPRTDALVVELLVSSIWQGAIDGVLRDDAERYLALRRARTERWKQGSVDYRINVLDRRLLLSAAQATSIREQIVGSLDGTFDRRRIESRVNPGVSGKQFWGDAVGFDLEVVERGLTLAQQAAMKHDATLAHFRFNGTLEDSGPRFAPFKQVHVGLRAEGLYVDGDYNFGRRDREPIETAGLNPTKFTVAIRFRPDAGADWPGRNVITACSSSRWFGLNADQNGQLFVTLANQRFSAPVPGAKVAKDTWTTVVCAVDLGRSEIRVRVDDADPVAVAVPPNLQVAGQSNFLFVNYSNGRVFHGVVDELLILNEALEDDAMRLLAVTHGFGARPPVEARRGLARRVQREWQVRAELWLDHARVACGLSESQTLAIKPAVSRAVDALVEQWVGGGWPNVETELQKAVLEGLPREVRERYRDTAADRNTRLRARDDSYVLSRIDDALLLSESQHTLLREILQTVSAAPRRAGETGLTAVLGKLAVDGLRGELDELQRAKLAEFVTDAQTPP